MKAQKTGTKLRIGFVALLYLALACSSPPAEPDQAGRIQNVEAGLLPEVIIEGLPTWSLAERMQHYNVPGVSIAVIENSEVAWSKGYGVMDIETHQPVTDTTRFQAASISKPVAAMAALKLVQEGKITLDEDINSYLRSWKLPENELTADRQVTLKNLINHSAGLTVHGFRGYAIDEAVPSLAQILDGAPPANSSAIRVDLAPETRFRYSGGGFTVMQQMLIDIEAKSFPEIMQDLVLGPLQMTNSTYDQPLTAAALKFTAAGHRRGGELVRGKRHTYPEMAAAGLWTTPTDLAKFAIELQKSIMGFSNRVLNRDMAELMLTPFVDKNWGLGIALDDKEGAIYFQHGGANEGFRCGMIAAKDNGYGAVVMTNSDNGGALAAEIMRSIAHEYGWQNYLPEPYRLTESDPILFERYRGRYRIDADNALMISLQGDTLFAEELAGDRFQLYPVTGDRFVRRDRDFVFRFEGITSGKSERIDLLRNGEEQTLERLDEETLLPSELAFTGDMEAAIQAYQSIFKEDPEKESSFEDRLNQFGYTLLGREAFDKAIAIFKVNCQLYPTSANTFDSLAEAYMLSGQPQKAITYYEKVLQILPYDESRDSQGREFLENNARSKLSELRGGKSGTN